MATIRHQVGIAADIEQIHRALTTTAGVSGWWTKTRGDFCEGGTIEFDFISMKMPMRVITQQDEMIDWQVLAGDDEWHGTHIIFTLEQRENQVMVNFRHEGWADTTDLFDHCSTKWAVFMLSLKHYVESGQGNPVPDDIPVNHY